MNEKTTARLKEAADLLAMVEEIMGTNLTGKTSVSAGVKITLRHAREAVIRSCIEVNRESSEEIAHPLNQSPQKESHPLISKQTTTLIPEVSRESAPALLHNPPTTVADSSDLSERLLNRKRDLRASIERMVDRGSGTEQG